MFLFFNMVRLMAFPPGNRGPDAHTHRRTLSVHLGPRPKDISRQCAALTGPTPLPPEFSMALHQCRWNYNDQEDVLAVSAKFDEHDIPIDIILGRFLCIRP